MSSEQEADNTARPALNPQVLDLTGLPPTVANELRRLVAVLRDNLVDPPPPRAESYEEWRRRFQAWIDSHPPRAVPVEIDDSRETIYAGRGE